MKKMFRKAFKATALMLAFSLLPFSPVLAAVIRPQASGKLTTTGNQSITVNGLPANNGDTILTGSSIETPNLVGASINLGSMGSVDIAPNTKFLLTFGTDNTVRIMLTEGCLILRVKQGTIGIISTEAGEVAHTDPVARPAAVLDVCQPKGAPGAIVNQGAASNAGAGAGVSGGTVAKEGVSAALLATLMAGGTGLGILLVVIAGRGETISESA